MTELISRSSNFYLVEMRFAVTYPTNQNFHTSFTRPSVCTIVALQHSDSTQFQAIFVEAFPQLQPLQLR